MPVTELRRKTQNWVCILAVHCHHLTHHGSRVPWFLDRQGAFWIYLQSPRTTNDLVPTIFHVLDIIRETLPDHDIPSYYVWTKQKLDKLSSMCKISISEGSIWVQIPVHPALPPLSPLIQQGVSSARNAFCHLQAH